MKTGDHGDVSKVREKQDKKNKKKRKRTIAAAADSSTSRSQKVIKDKNDDDEVSCMKSKKSGKRPELNVARRQRITIPAVHSPISDKEFAT